MNLRAAPPLRKQQPEPATLLQAFFPAQVPPTIGASLPAAMYTNLVHLVAAVVPFIAQHAAPHTSTPAAANSQIS